MFELRAHGVLHYFDPHNGGGFIENAFSAVFCASVLGFTALRLLVACYGAEAIGAQSYGWVVFFMTSAMVLAALSGWMYMCVCGTDRYQQNAVCFGPIRASPPAGRMNT